MKDAFKPLAKQSLSDRLARQIRRLIREGGYTPGDRLPAIMEMARSFGVGHPTVREALKQLEAMGTVEIRHGSGVYVTRSEDVLVVATPDYAGDVSRKLLTDLIEARTPLEVQSVTLAARHGSAEQLREMRRLLTTAGENLDNDELLNSINIAFHRQIGLASGNLVLVQLLDVLSDLFTEEQRLIISIFGSRERDHEEHLALLEALEQRNEELGGVRMRAHLEGVQAAIRRWDAQRQAAS